MGYHGVLSTGCDRCRQRKVKCDERRPHCAKCEALGHKCPGYRDLARFRFRNENARIVRRSQKKIHPTPTIDEAEGRKFLFSMFAFPEPPPFDRQRDWLKQAVADDGSVPIRKGAAAVGLAALANVNSDLRLASRARLLRNELLEVVNQATSNLRMPVSDSVLIALCLLMLFETVTARTWTTFQSRSQLIDTATHILAVRGVPQFGRPLSSLLYVQIRHDLLLECSFNCVPVPPSLVQVACDFSQSGGERWRSFADKSPGSIGEMAFRIVNLQAVVYRNRDPKESGLIRPKIAGVFEDLDLWTQGLSKAWEHPTTPSTSEEHGFCGEKHVYTNIWIAEVWNSWRVLYILASQVFLQNEKVLEHVDHTAVDRARCNIQNFSTAICLSVATLFPSRRCLSIVHILCVVAREGLNSPITREFAIEQLCEVYRVYGIAQAQLFADTARQCLDGSGHVSWKEQRPDGFMCNVDWE